MASVSIKITGDSENDPITEIDCGRTSPKLGGNINISMFPELTGFACRYNDIQNISNFALNPNLQKMEIDGNQLTQINSGSGLSSNLQLQYFDCSNNSITGNIFDLSLNTNLTYFNCSGNKFTGFQSGNQIPYTLETFNANNNYLYQTSVDSILDAFVNNNRTSEYGNFYLDLNGTNKHPSLSDGNVLIYSSGSGFLRSGTTLVTANVSGHGFSNGTIITISGITNATQLNGTYIVTGASTNQFQYNTTGAGFATGSGMAIIRSTSNKNDGFRKYQILTLPTGQTIFDSVNGDIQGRGLNVQINSFFDGIQIGNTISGFTGVVGQNDYLGNSVDINDEGSRVVIGGPYSDNNLNDASNLYYGVVRVYELNDSNWIKIGQDIMGEAQNDYFGWSVSMNSDGNRIAVGYYGGGSGDTGTTKIYEWNGNEWVQIGQNITGLTTSDSSGWFVQLNSDGSRIVIAEKEATTTAPNTGKVRIFEYNGSTWVQMGETINGLAAYDGVNRVCINTTGDIIVYSSIGADSPQSLTNVGVVRAYSWDGVEWNKMGQDIYGDGNAYLLGRSLSLNSIGDVFAVGTYSLEGGRVYVYKYNGSRWNQLGQTFIAPLVTATYGYSVSLNSIGDRLAIGDRQRGGTSLGAVEVYEYNGSKWEKLVRDLIGTPWTAGQATFFGESVSLNKLGDRLAVGSPAIRGGWTQIYQLPPSLGEINIKPSRSTYEWIIKPLPVNYWNEVAAGPINTLVAVGLNEYSYSLDNGETWSDKIIINSDVGNELYNSLSYGNNTWVMMESLGYTPNGTQNYYQTTDIRTGWTRYDMNPQLSGLDFTDMVYNQNYNRFVAVGDQGGRSLNNNIFGGYSTDGSNWSTSTYFDQNNTPIIDPQGFTALTMGSGMSNGTMVACGAAGNHKFAYSNNGGLSWIKGNYNPGASGQNLQAGCVWNSVAYGYNTGFISSPSGRFVGVGGGTSFKFAYSDDGISWVGVSYTSPELNRNWTCVTYANDNFIALSETGGYQAISYDGINWSSSKNIPSTVKCTDIIASSNRLIAVLENQASTGNAVIAEFTEVIL